MSHMASHRDEMLEFEQEMGTPLEGDDFELVAPSSSKAGVHLDDHFQNFHSRISRPTSLLPPSSARLLQRLQICWETASPDGFAPFPNRFTQTHSHQKKAGPISHSAFHGHLNMILYDVTSHFKTCSHRSHLNRPLVSFAPHPLCAIARISSLAKAAIHHFGPRSVTLTNDPMFCVESSQINLHRFTLHHHSTHHFNKPCQIHYKPTFNFSPPASTRLKSTCAGHSHP